MKRPQQPPLILALSITQIASWGSLYYAFAVLARPIQAELGWSADLAVGAYSLALLIAGIGAYPAGKLIDRYGGRRLMTAGSCLAGLLFAALSQITSLYAFYAAWIAMGVAMAMTLYEPAFAVIVAAFPNDYRKRIGVLTLAGGFASTVFWPLTHALVTTFDWRCAVLVLGAVNLALCAPLHWLTVPDAPPKLRPAPPLTGDLPAHLTPGLRRLLRQPVFWLVAFCFMTFGFVSAAMAVHVIPLLESRGIAPLAAVALAALVGPMQVAGRLAELLFGARLPALTVGAITMLLMPAGLMLLWLGSASLPLVYAFVAVYGTGLGLITLVRAATPPELFGRQQYASVSGALAGPGIAARAIGPFAATAALTAFGSYRAVLTLLVTISAVGALAYWTAIALHRGAQPRA
jgi:MFS family permease